MNSVFLLQNFLMIQFFEREQRKEKFFESSKREMQPRQIHSVIDHNIITDSNLYFQEDFTNETDALGSADFDEAFDEQHERRN